MTKNTTVLESERPLKMRHCRLAPVAETGFSHRLTAYEIEISLTVISENTGHDQVENNFF